eukprot:GSMAST32.ASY1.ANO1.993.1 assembled CDS
MLPTRRYGLADKQAVFTRQILRNRQSKKLYSALNTILPPWDGFTYDCQDILDNPKTSQVTANSVVFSQDRWCLYPPSLGNPQRQTNNPGAHLDICPWQYLSINGPNQTRNVQTNIDNLRYKNGLYDFRAEINCVKGKFGPHNQGILNLIDAYGGTAVVPGFHKCYPKWSQSLGTYKENRVGQLFFSYEILYLTNFKFLKCFFTKYDPIHKLMRRVTLRAGSLLLWNQCTVHGAQPNTSDRPRVAQFVRGFRFVRFQN